MRLWSGPLDLRGPFTLSEWTTALAGRLQLCKQSGPLSSQCFFFFKQSFIDTCSVSWPLKCLPLQNDTHTKGFLLERLFPPQPPATKFIMINQYFICKYSFTCKEFGHVRINNPFNWISNPKNPFHNFNIALAHGK